MRFLCGAEARRKFISLVFPLSSFLSATTLPWLLRNATKNSPASAYCWHQRKWVSFNSFASCSPVTKGRKILWTLRREWSRLSSEDGSYSSPSWFRSFCSPWQSHCHGLDQSLRRGWTFPQVMATFVCSCSIALEVSDDPILRFMISDEFSIKCLWTGTSTCALVVW